MRWFILDLKKKRRKCGFDCLICLRTLFSASWGKFSPFITLVMACWFNLPRGFFQKAFSIFGMWWWHNSDFFDVPMSPSFHYLCRTWSREETELTILSWGHSCFPAPLPVTPFFLISPPLFRSWRHGRAGRGLLLPGSSGFDSLSWGEAWAFLPAEPWEGLTGGWAQTRGMGSDPHARAVRGWAEPRAEMAVGPLAAGHVRASPSSAVLPFCDPCTSYRTRAWGLSCRELRPWSQIA